MIKTFTHPTCHGVSQKQEKCITGVKMFAKPLISTIGWYLSRSWTWNW